MAEELEPTISNPKKSSLKAVWHYWVRAPQGDDMLPISVQLAAREGNTPEDIAEMAEAPLDVILEMIAADPWNSRTSSSA